MLFSILLIVFQFFLFTHEQTTQSCSEVFKYMLEYPPAQPGNTKDCNPPSYTVPGYSSLSDQGTAQANCYENYKEAIAGLRICVQQYCSIPKGYDPYCVCQKCKGQYYNINAPYRNFMYQFLVTCCGVSACPAYSS